MNPARCRRLTAWSAVVLLATLPAGTAARASEPEPAPARWRHVLWGGGYITGIALHPTVREVAYARTDMGSAYRWDAAGSAWVPLLDGLPADAPDLLGVESVAVDPADPTGRTAFVTLGRYVDAWAKPSRGDLFKTTDAGRTWQPAGLGLGIASNRDQMFGERLAVDPRGNGAVFYASRQDGLWRSERGGERGSWQRLDGVPLPDHDLHGSLRFLVFAPTSVTPDGGDPVAGLYLGVQGRGVQRSDDGGNHWQPLPGGPPEPSRGVVARDNTLYVTHAAGLAAFADGAWRDVTPSAYRGKRFGAIAVDPRDPRHLLTARLEWGHHQPLFRSTDAGATWREFRREDVTLQTDPVAYLERQPWLWASAPASFAFDPHVPGRVWLTDWTGTWRTEDVAAERPAWRLFLRGHEQGAVLSLRCPPAGAPLLSAAADAEGFRHTDPTGTYPTGAYKNFGGSNTSETTGLDFAGRNPDLVARVGAVDLQRAGGGAFTVSRDNGAHWQVVHTAPKDAWGGRVAVAADGGTVVWQPQGREAAALVSGDFGVSWATCRGLPAGVLPGENIWNWSQPLAADRVDPSAFYLFHDGVFHRSADGGRNWERGGRLPAAGNVVTVEPTPNTAGEVWVGLEAAGLFRTVDAGRTFGRVPGVNRATSVALGRPAAGSERPTVFLLGEVHGRRGLFWSVDDGANWKALSDADHTFATANCLAADQQTFGRVYVGTNGRGIFCGDAAGP